MQFDYRTCTGLGKLTLGTNKTLCVPGARTKKQSPHKRLSQPYLRVCRSLRRRPGLLQGRGTERSSGAETLLRGLIICRRAGGRVQLCAAPWTAARHASLSITNSQSLLTLRCIKSVVPSSHLILYRPLLLLPSIFPSITVFSNEAAHLVAKVLEFQHQSFQ